MSKSKIIGIDLGTTNSVLAFLDGDRPEVIPNAEGNKLTPSIALFDDHDEILVGEMAKRQLVTKPGQCIRSVKRLIGRRLSEIEESGKSVEYELAADADGNVLVAVHVLCGCHRLLQ